jgi:pilus assembly protein CpaF
MMRVTIRRQESSEDEVHEFTLPQITIGRTDRNHVVLPNNRVSSVHARVIENDEGIVLVDNNSTNGTFVNGELVRGPVVLAPHDAVDVGVFTLYFERVDEVEGGEVAEYHEGDEHQGHDPGPSFEEPGYAEPAEFAALAAEPGELEGPPELLAIPAEPTPADLVAGIERHPSRAHAIERQPSRANTIESVGPAGSGSFRVTLAQDEPARPSRRTTEVDSAPAEPPKNLEDALELAFRQCHEQMLGEPPGPQAHQRALGVAREVVERVLVALDPRQRRQWTDWLAREVAGTGPLSDILADTTVSEVLVVGASHIEVGRGEQRARHPARFSCEQAVSLALERLIGARTTTVAPILDGVTDEGVVVHAVGRPFASAGPILVLSRPAGDTPGLAQLVEKRALSQPAADLLSAALGKRLNFIVCAQTRADPGPLLGALASELPPGQRVVAVHRGPVAPALASRAIVLDAGRDAAAALRSAVRFRPDWLFVQDLGGVEVAELCAAARRTGGATVAAVAAEDVESGLSRLQAALALAAPAGDPQRLRAYVAGCFDLAIAVRRTLTGRDLVAQVAELRRGEVVELFARADDEGALQSTGVAASVV